MIWLGGTSAFLPVSHAEMGPECRMVGFATSGIKHPLPLSCCGCPCLGQNQGAGPVGWSLLEWGSPTCPVFGSTLPDKIRSGPQAYTGLQRLSQKTGVGSAPRLWSLWPAKGWLFLLFLQAQDVVGVWGEAEVVLAPQWPTTFL